MLEERAELVSGQASTREVIKRTSRRETGSYKDTFVRLSLIAGVASSYAAALADFFVNPSVAAAKTDICEVEDRIEAYQFFDMAQVTPGMGRRHILDRGIDPRAGGTAGFEVDAKSLDGKLLASTNIIRDPKDGVGRGTLGFKAPCNTTTVTSNHTEVPALAHTIETSQDRDNHFRVVVGDKRYVLVWVGREVKNPKDFIGLTSSGVRIDDFSDEKRKAVERYISAGGAPTSAPVPTVPSGPIGGGESLTERVVQFIDWPSRTFAPDAPTPLRVPIDAVVWAALAGLGYAAWRGLRRLAHGIGHP